MAGEASQSLSVGVQKFNEALPAHCRANGAAVADFKILLISFDMLPTVRRAVVTVEDKASKTTAKGYSGVPLRRRRSLNALGRVRSGLRKVIVTGCVRQLVAGRDHSGVALARARDAGSEKPVDGGNSKHPGTAS